MEQVHFPIGITAAGAGCTSIYPSCPCHLESRKVASHWGGSQPRRGRAILPFGSSKEDMAGRRGRDADLAPKGSRARCHGVSMRRLALRWQGSVRGCETRSPQRAATTREPRRRRSVPVRASRLQQPTGLRRGGIALPLAACTSADQHEGRLGPDAILRRGRRGEIRRS